MTLNIVTIFWIQIRMEEEELLRRAIALSLERTLEDNEESEELLKKAIALSLSD